MVLTIPKKLFIINHSLNVCVGRRRPRRPALQRNHPKKLLIIHYSLKKADDVINLINE